MYVCVCVCVQCIHVYGQGSPLSPHTLASNPNSCFGFIRFLDSKVPCSYSVSAIGESSSLRYLSVFLFRRS